MRFFHLSDLHIGLKLRDFDLTEDQKHILKEIVEAASKEKPDAVVIAGDIYNRAVPSAEAVELFDFFITQLTKAVPEAAIMIISGNHDSAPRLDVFRNILCRQNVYMVGMPPVNPEDYIEKVVLNDSFGNVNFYLLPFVRPSMVNKILGFDENENNFSYNDSLHKLIGRENIDTDERNVLVSHQFYLPIGADPEKIERMDSEICTVGNIDEVKADVLETFDYAALGHIHKPMKVGKEEYRYCGTPLACSVSEAGQQKGIILVEMKEKGNVETSVIPLHPLRGVRVIEGSLENVLKQGCDDYVLVVLTDKVDFDVIDMQDRIRDKFPHLLEIRRESIQKIEYDKSVTSDASLSPFEFCCQFLGGLDDGEENLLRDVINTIQGVK